MDFLVELHSGLRWLLLAALIVLAVMGLVGWRKGSSSPSVLIRGTVIVMDIQVLAGIVLLIGNQRWDDTFYGLIHPVLMLVALVVLHIGRHRSRMAEQPSAGRILTVTTLLTLGLILAAIPW